MTTYTYDEKNYVTIFEELKTEGFALVINLEETESTSFIASDLDTEKIGFIYKEGSIYPTPTAEKYWRMGILGPSPQNDILKKDNKQTYQDLIMEVLQLEDDVDPPVFIMILFLPT